MNNIVERYRTEQLITPQIFTDAATTYNGVAAGSAVGIDTRDFDEAMVVVNLGVLNDTSSLVFTVMFSDVGNTAAAAEVYEDFEGNDAVFATIDGSADDNKTFVVNVQCKNAKRYMYLRLVKTGIEDDYVQASVVLGNYERAPVDQTETVAFNR